MDTLSASLAEARLYLNSNQPQQALSAIKPHRTLAYEQLGDYHEVWHLLSGMRKQFNNKAAYEARRIEVAKALFTADNSSLDDIEKVWSELSRAAKKDENLFLNYISGLAHNGQEEKAEQLLAKAIKNNFSDALIHAYTQLEAGSSTARLEKYRYWLHYHDDNAYLNYGAAKSAFQSEKFEAARYYAETSLKSLPLPETFALLGKILEALGDKQNALQAYKGSVGLIYANEPRAIAGEVLPAANNLGLPAGGADDAPKPVAQTVEEQPQTT